MQGETRAWIVTWWWRGSVVWECGLCGGSRVTNRDRWELGVAEQGFDEFLGIAGRSACGSQDKGDQVDTGCTDRTFSSLRRALAAQVTLALEKKA